jgi:hypothetical protein
MLRQRRGFQRLIEFFMERQPPLLHLFPIQFASPDRQKPIAVFVHSERNEAIPQNYNAL